MSILQKIKEAWGKITVAPEEKSAPLGLETPLQKPETVEIPIPIAIPIKVKLPSFELSKREEKPPATGDLPESSEPALQPEPPKTETLPTMKEEGYILVERGTVTSLYCLHNKGVIEETKPICVTFADGSKAWFYSYKPKGQTHIEIVNETGQVVKPTRNKCITQKGYARTSYNCTFYNEKEVKLTHKGSPMIHTYENGRAWLYQFKTPEQKLIAKTVVGMGEKGAQVVEPQLFESLKQQYGCVYRKEATE